MIALSLTGPATNGAPPDPPPPRKRSNYLWLWFFLIVGVLAAGAIAFLWWYNLSLQLKPEQLDAAWQLWKKRGPADYDLSYTKTGSVEDQISVRVRGGKVQDIRVRGQPLEEINKDEIKKGRPLEELYEFYGMDALFRDVERFLKIDSEPGKPRTYTRASFDADDGHLVHYVRRVMGTQERLEITVDFKPVARPRARP
jgi:hypothetical protein